MITLLILLVVVALVVWFLYTLPLPNEARIIITAVLIIGVLIWAVRGHLG